MSIDNSAQVYDAPLPLRATADVDLVVPPEYHSDPERVTRGRRGMPRRFPGATTYFYSAVFRAMRGAARRAKGSCGLSDTYFVKRSSDLLRAAERCGTEVHVTGLDRVRDQCLKGPVVFVANHMSTLETFTLPGMLLPLTPLTFVLKKELISYPLLGTILETLVPITVGRADPRADLKKTLAEGQARLGGGRSVVVFPQTTRSTHFDRGAFNSLGVKLAVRANVPVVPLALRTDFWSPGKLIKDFGPIRPDNPIHFAFGMPLEVDRSRARESQDSIVDFIRRNLTQWGIPDRTQAEEARAT